jgi:hypothetical protein
MYKACFILLLSSLVAAPAVAEDSPQQPQGAGETSPRAASREKPAAKPAAPASTFKPSEEVSADSAVSFPVDI